jgi:predicted ABC-type transport system involved in lysophospholipase L1 biosynthesis ATPase subunit
VEDRLRAAGASTRRGGDFDRWDLEARGGMLAGARVRMAVEEHGGGRQQLRFRITPRTRRAGVAAIVAIALAGTGAAFDGAPAAAGVLVAMALALVACTLIEAAASIAAVQGAVDPAARAEPEAVPPAADLLDRLRGDIGAGELVALVGGLDDRPHVLHELVGALHDHRDEGGEVAPETGRGRDFGVIAAKPILLPLSVAENIALGRPGASEAEIRAAASAAGADAFIQQLPRGYQTLVDRHASWLTDEQSHRLALARAFLQDPAVLILTHPVERLGNGCGERLRPVFERLVAGRRTLVLAESADHAHDASRVFAVEEGELVEVQ